MFLSNPGRFLTGVSFPKPCDLSLRMMPHKAAEIIVHDKSHQGFCTVTLMDEERVVKGDPILLIHFKENKFIFENEYKLQRFLVNPFKYCKSVLPVKMPHNEDPVNLHSLQKMDDSISFMEQSLGQIVTRALREIAENRLKYPTISVKETMLKLFALFLKSANPANTEYTKGKYAESMRKFVERCEMVEELYDLS